MRKVLVLRGGALGDFIVTLPALALLRERWSDARIELIGNATAAQLAVTRGLLDAAHSQHDARWAALYGEAALAPELATWLVDFDFVLNYWPDPDGELRRRFPLRAGQTFLSGAALPTRGPAAAHYCEPLRTLGLEPRVMWYPLQPYGAAERGGRLSAAGLDSPSHSQTLATNHAGTQTGSENRPYPQSQSITIHPGSGSPRKNWPLESWRELIAHLTSLPYRLTVLLGEAEEARETIAQLKLPASAEVLLKRPLEELVAHLAPARLFIGHDSGISHLAAACGAPGVLLFGSTEPAIWAPPVPSVRVLRRHPEVSSISVSEVQRAVAAALADPR